MKFDQIYAVMTSLGYKVNKTGVCQGLAIMSMQAIQLGEVGAYNHRIDNINKLYSYLFAAPQIDFLNKEALFISPKSGEEMVDRVNEFKVKSLPERIEMLSGLEIEETAQFLIDMQAFFDGIVLGQSLNRYPELFISNVVPAMQDLSLTLLFVMSKALVEKGGLSKFKRFTCMYDKKMLKEIFFSLENICHQHDSISYPISFQIGSTQHIIHIAYDPQKKQWLYSNLEEFKIRPIPTDMLENIDQIVNILFREFPHEANNSDFIAFSIEIFGHAKNFYDLQKLVTEWKASSEWKDAHRISSEKAQQIDGVGSSWLWMATMFNEYQTAQALLENGANIHQPLPNGCTPLAEAGVRKFYGLQQLFKEHDARFLEEFNVEVRLYNTLYPL